MKAKTSPSGFLVLLAVGVACSLTSVGRASAVPIFSDFSFGSGTPFGGSTTVAGVGVTLVTTNTEPADTTSFRNLITTAADAAVSFTFGAAISEFALDVSRVRADEFLKNFSLGLPSSLSGTLAVVGGKVTTTTADDFGTGILTWTGINVTSVTFDLESPLSAALKVDEFGISPVPEPGTLALAALGLLGLGSRGARRHRQH